MGSVDDAPPGTALTSARRPCLHFHCAFWFTRQRARAHVALLGPCFKTGRTRPSEYQQHWRTSDAHRHEITATVSTARSPHRTAHSNREAPPFGVHHNGQGLPFFLGRAGAPHGRAISCRRGTNPRQLTFRCRLVAPIQPPLVRAHEEYGTALGERHGTISVHASAPSAVLEPARSLHQPRSFPP